MLSISTFFSSLFSPPSMATVHENGILMHEEFELEDGCGCFRSIWPTSKRHAIGDDDRLNLLQGAREENELWVVIQLKKLREASELIAGPKWKNFIRKFGAYFNNRKKNDFRYDSYNYTLNFDDGMHENDEEGGNLGFSSRFAPPVPDKARMSS